MAPGIAISVVLLSPAGDVHGGGGGRAVPAAMLEGEEVGHAFPGPCV